MPGIRPPVFYPKWSVAYRIDRLVRALGWSYAKLSRYMDITYLRMWRHFEIKYTYANKGQHKPYPELLRKLYDIEKTYRKAVKCYTRTPNRMDRTPALQRSKPRYLRLQPFPEVRPNDPKAMGILEAFRKDEIKRLRTPLDDEGKERRTRINARMGKRVALSKIKLGLRQRAQHEADTETQSR